jgi:hypothetical protein
MSVVHPKPWPQTLAVLALVSTGLWFGTAAPLLEVQAQKAWAPVPCTVVSTRIRHYKPQDASSHYQPFVRCRYEVGGTRYEEEIQLHTENRFEPAAKARIAALPDGKALTCFVNPDNPAHYVIDHVTPIWPFVIGLLLLFILCLSVAGFWLVHRKKLRALGDLDDPHTL